MLFRSSSVIAERAIWLILECDVDPAEIAVIVSSTQDDAAMREIFEAPLRRMQYKTVPTIMTQAAFKTTDALTYRHVLADDVQAYHDAARAALSSAATRGATLFVTVRSPGESAVSEHERRGYETALASFLSAARFELVWVYRKPDAKKRRGQASGEEQMSLF